MMQAIQSQNATVAETAPSSICAIASGKGGVGKTWFSITLAQAMARMGARTLLFDGDFGLANVDVQLGLNPSRDLSGVISGQYRLAEATIRYDEGFHVVAGRSGSGSLVGMPGAYMERMCSAMTGVSEHYDRVVLDLGAGIERGVLRMAAGAGLCIVLTTDEPTALTDAYAFMKLRYQDDPGADVRVVVNMAPTESQGERTFRTLRKACESFLKKTPDLAGVIRHDSKVRDAIRHQTPILTRHPTCNAARDVERVARAILKG